MGPPDFGLSAAQRREAVLSHYHESPGMDGARGEIWCYSDQYAYPHGATVRLYISSRAASCRFAMVRDGGTEQRVLDGVQICTRWQDTPDQASVCGCGWEQSHTFQVDPAWPSGAYRLELTAEGRDQQPIRCEHLIIVRPRPQSRHHKGRLLQIAATGTWTAYNTWGGSNHYQGITGPNRDQYAPCVSTQRPFARGFASLPPDAPRVPLRFDTAPGEAPRYPHMEWAFANGYSKKYASSGWASYDSHFHRWAERAGFQVDLISQHELHFQPEILQGYDCVSMVGHDEYWTWEMRDAIDQYVESGGRVARFAGNFMWQTRLEDEGRRQVCYKYRSRAEDPVYKSGDPRRTTNLWEAPETGRPAAQTFGLNATSGLYAGWGGCAPRGVRGFPVYRPEHWAFAGTGLYYGDLLGAQSQVFGYEVDGLPYVIRNGLPEPTSEGSPPPGLSILALGMSSLIEESADIARENQFLTDVDARYVASILSGDDGPAALDRHKRGCGMMVHFARGKGEVFHAGSCEWVAGLLRKDAMVEQVTRNVLQRYLGA